jgi:diguanylate cyclase (GGDEF)-like protein
VAQNDHNDENERQDKTQIAAIKTKVDESSQAMDPCLTQLSGLGSGQVFNLKNQELKIGRDPEQCKIWAEDPHISRIHATVKNENDSTTITDLQSTNGVFVNGKKIQEHVLKNGDRILVGTRLYFKYSLEFADYQQVQNQKYREANCDSLTKLYNKRFFVDILSREFSYSRRNKTPLTLLMIDIDFFKKINDSYGHLAGDFVLSNVGDLLRKELRHENIACRYGGEEFAIILRNTDPKAAENVAERIRSKMEGLDLTYNSHQLKITVSIGIGTYDHLNFETYEELIKFTDELLYESKLNGRNRITLKKAA